LEREVADSVALPCDVSYEGALADTLRNLENPKIVVHNVVGGAFGTFDKIEPEALRRNFEVNTMALFHLARLTAPAMIEAGEGAIVVTGNTSAQRGRAAFAGFAPTKAAQRILAESLARDLGPKRVHVAYLVIDAAIDVPWRVSACPTPRTTSLSRPRRSRKKCIIAHQPRDAWSFLAEVRPYREHW
jgi:NAD(P)-dependent dehydrogenase (short-subunit alcohol dehydrogenase family)